MQRGIHAAGAHEVSVRPTLDDAALVDDDNLVGGLRRGQAVRDRDRGAPTGESLEGPALPITTIVRQAARAAIASEHPIRVMDGDQMVGVVDEEDIMRVVVAEEES